MRAGCKLWAVVIVTGVLWVETLLAGSAQTAAPASPLVWDLRHDRVTANIHGWPVTRLLEEIASRTGWQVFVEPDTDHVVSTSFRDLPPGQALARLLGELSYALIPQADGTSKLFVFQTSMGKATQAIKPAPPKPDPTAKPIPNEVVVLAEPGTDIEALAKELGGKITGKVDKLNAYRLTFDDEESAAAARRALQDKPGVKGLDSNYHMRPPDPLEGLTGPGGPLTLKPKPMTEGEPLIVGLIDTPVQPTGTSMDKLMLEPISVAGLTQAPQTEAPSHGTSMFETLLSGVAASGQETSIRVLPVDVYGERPSTTTFDVAHGIVQAVNQGARVINLSLGSAGDSVLLRQVIQQASQQGIVFFAAAGNEPGTAPSFPAAYPEVIAVTAGLRDGSVAPYANRGDFVDLVAPGSSVVIYNGQRWLVTGTSASTAYATGVAAGLIEKQRTSPEEVSQALQAILPPKR